MNEWMIPRPVITVMSGERREGFIGVNVTFDNDDQVDAMFGKLERHAESLARKDGIDWDQGNVFMLGIVMPCGSRFLFRRAVDMPRETLPCNCGDPDHVVVKFTQKLVKESVRQPVWP